MSKQEKVYISSSEDARKVQELVISYKDAPDNDVFNEILDLLNPMLFKFARQLTNDFIETKRYDFNYDYMDVINIYRMEVFRAIGKYDVNNKKKCMFTTYMYDLFKYYTMTMSRRFNDKKDFVATSLNVNIQGVTDDDGTIGDYIPSDYSTNELEDFILVDSVVKVIEESDLTPHCKKVFKYFVENNQLSYSDVARRVGLSPQRVHDIVKKSSKKLLPNFSEILLAK